MHLLPQVPFLCGLTFFIHLKFHGLLYSLTARYIQQVFLLVILVQQNTIPCYIPFSTSFVPHLCNNTCLKKPILTALKTRAGPDGCLAVILGSNSFTCSFSYLLSHLLFDPQICGAHFPISLNLGDFESLFTGVKIEVVRGVHKFPSMHVNIRGFLSLNSYTVLVTSSGQSPLVH